MSNPFVDELALRLAENIIGYWPHLKQSARAPQHKARIQVAIIKAIEDELASAARGQA